MTIELLDLITKNKKINIDSDINIPLDLIEISNIRKLYNVHFIGSLSKLVDDTYNLTGTISGTMIVPDDITLEDFEYNFTGEIEEKIDETRIISQKTLDITEDLWQNILVEVPSKAVNEKNKNIKLEGKGWRLISEDEVNLSNSNDNPFKDLL